MLKENQDASHDTARQKLKCKSLWHNYKVMITVNSKVMQADFPATLKLICIDSDKQTCFSN
ncbi:hypothetical protein NC651_010709 [Populus alba x Populus x berolinensis]|nr:hypothetical protein NC651_010709 [Populus alba x Populus x berolinensis]